LVRRETDWCLVPGPACPSAERLKGEKGKKESTVPV